MARAPTDPLATYNAKRDFKRTAEPAGQIGAEAGQIFMVQKHDATRLHWDFRLELDGVLKSWAVTRGPSPDPDDKRLAVRTEDHPLAYATFEGTIPKGEYGGGTVMLWDRGTWESLPGKDPRKTIEEGHLHFFLHGERMKGEWLMIRLKPRGREKGENWLLRKIADEHVGASGDLIDRAITSIVTGRSMAEIAAGKIADAPEKPSSRRASASKAAGTSAAKKAGVKRSAKPKKSLPAPPFQSPQLATLVDTVPTGSGWLHEVKYDGYRALVAFGEGEAKAYTRTGLDWSDRFGPVVAAAAKLPGSGLIDGEVVVLDPDGRPSFQALQASLKEGGGNLAFFAFDLLSIDGEDLTSLGNLQRKERLAPLMKGARRAAPLFRARHRPGREVVREPVQAGAGRRDLEAGRRALSRQTQPELAQDQMPPPSGVRDRRLDAQRQGAWLPLAAARRAWRGWCAAVCRQGGHGLRHAHDRRSDGADEAARAGRRDREGSARGGARRALDQAQARGGGRLYRVYR